MVESSVDLDPCQSVIVGDPIERISVAVATYMRQLLTCDDNLFRNCHLHLCLPHYRHGGNPRGMVVVPGYGTREPGIVIAV